MRKTGTPPAMTAVQRRKLLGDNVLEDVHMFRADRHSFIVYVGGDPTHQGDRDYFEYDEPGVEYLMADRFVINLNTLSGIDPKRPILVIMSSCGGNYDEGMQMFAAILTCPNPVTVLAMKWARSMTSIIPLAADRFMLCPPARYMIHYGKYGFEGLHQEATTLHVEMLKETELMMRLYTARLKEQGQYRERPEKDIRELLEKRILQQIDVWHSADDAVVWGFADGVYTGDLDTLRAQMRNEERRAKMLEVLRKPIRVDVKIT